MRRLPVCGWWSWYRASTASSSGRRPSLIQLTVGWGNPAATHGSWAVSCSVTTSSRSDSSIDGGTMTADNTLQVCRCDNLAFNSSSRYNYSHRVSRWRWQVIITTQFVAERHWLTLKDIILSKYSCVLNERHSLNITMNCVATCTLSTVTHWQIIS